jgi:hypothetical protein
MVFHLYGRELPTRVPVQERKLTADAWTTTDDLRSDSPVMDEGAERSMIQDACCSQLDAPTCENAETCETGAKDESAFGEGPHVEDQPLGHDPIAYGTSTLWSPGDPVERLLDDISDIWAGAVVVLVHKQSHHYDISYADDGTIECGVEESELRPRQVRLDMPAEVWESVGNCLYDCRDLCTFEQIALASRSAMRRNSELWWCAAFHQRFGRCCGRCQFEKISGPEGARCGAASVRQCFTRSTFGQTSVDKIPWKARYIDYERLNDPARGLAETLEKHTPGDIAYGITGKKINYDNPLKGWFFDPRLGRMVHES